MVETTDPVVAPLVIGPVEIGAVAHGGHCVARHDGRVIFVRHGLPGEIVRVRITDRSSASYWRGDVVEVLRPSPDRVEPRCVISGAGGCGGCDFQHVDLAAQRRLKTQVVAEQLQHLAGITWDGVVQAVPDVDPDRPGLGWRTRMRYQTDEAGVPSMRVHRSRQLIALPDAGCGLASHPAAEVVGRDWPGDVEISVVDAASGLLLQAGEKPGGQHGSADLITEQAAGRSWLLRRDGFWQIHPESAGTLVEAVLAGLRPRAGEQAFDLYCGVGLFAGALADQGCQVWGVEVGRTAIGAARRNLADVKNQVRLTSGRVERELHRLPDRTDLVVLDPPRTGAKRKVMEAVCQRRPRAIAYVACDPAALGRDLGLAQEFGYRVVNVQAYDLFPMTHHVECVAILEPSQS